MTRGKLLIFSAPSGSGKSTIVNEMMNRFENLTFSVSATNRAARGEEKEGVHYHFLSTEEFQRKIDSNEFLEWEEVYPGRFYGSLKSDIEEKRSAGLHVVFDIDVVGGANLKKLFGDEALALFIQVSDIKILEQRLRNRGTDSNEEITIRLSKAKEEMTYADQFDHIVVNDDLNESFDTTEQLIQKFIEE